MIAIEVFATWEFPFCVAMCNGAMYIWKHILLTLPQLGEVDEMLVIDDAPVNDSVTIADKYVDRRMRIICPKRPQRWCDFELSSGR